MTSRKDPLLTKISELLTSGGVVPVVGSGVSTSVAGIPGWKKIIQNGINHIADVGIADEHELQDVHNLLSQPDLIMAAQKVRGLLGAPRGEFPLWLKKVFGVERNDIRNPLLINRIVDLPCSIIVTTNYDKIISIMHPNSPTIATWQDSTAMQEALREGNKVIHLHGVYDKPESIILGKKDYRELTRHDGYRAVLQTLWLERTLLFIGCSFDGLQDPDFSRLLTWASETFEGSPYKHFALLRSGTYSTEDVAKFLNEWRIQIVGYGTRFEDLPAWIEQVNPSKERAVAERIAIVKDIIDNGNDEDLRRLSDILEDLARPDAPPDIDIKKEAEQLFTSRGISYKQFRGDLSALQQLTRTIVDPDIMDREIQRWKKNRSHTWRPPRSFYDTVLAAAEALFLFDDSLLVALYHRSVDIHDSILDGFCKKLINRLRRGNYFLSQYDIENLKRILTALQAILAVDPMMTFPIPKIEQARTISGKTLVVVRNDRVELRRWENPIDIIATLPIEPKMASRAEVHPYHGGNALIIENNILVLVWDPRRSVTALAEYQVSGRQGITSAAHLDTSSGLRSVVSTIDGKIHELIDFKLDRTIQLPERGSDKNPFLGEITLLPNGRLFGIYHYSEEIVEVGNDGHLLSLFNKLDLIGLLDNIPNVQIGPSHHIGHSELRSVELDGQIFLAQISTVRAPNRHDTVVIFLHPKNRSVEMYAHYYIRDRDLIDFTIVLGEDKRSQLIGVLLSDFNHNYDQVVWARASKTSKGQIFFHEGSLGRTDNDMVTVIATDLGDGFAGDNNGGLFTFSIKEGALVEIDRDKKSKIRNLLVCKW